MTYKIVLLALCLLGVALYTTACSSSVPDKLGVKNGKLASCPSSPNCISSQDTDKEHSFKALKASGDTNDVMLHLADTIKEMNGKVITIEGPYLHAEFRSKIFRFVDDLECYYDESKELIEIRSAARLGYSDFSVNRKRAEELRALFKKTKQSISHYTKP